MENSFLILFLYNDVPENIQIQDGHQTPSWKSAFLTIYHRMLFNMSFKEFSSMQNPILILFLSFKAGPVSAVGSPSSRGLRSGIRRFNSRVGTFCHNLAVTFERRTLSTSKTQGLSLSRITDHPDMTSAVYSGR